MALDLLQLGASALIGAVSYFGSKLFDRESARSDARLHTLEAEVKILRENDATHAERIASVQQSVTTLTAAVNNFVDAMSKKMEQLLISSARLEGALSSKKDSLK